MRHDSGIQDWLRKRLGEECGPSHDPKRSVWVSASELYTIYYRESKKDPVSSMAFGKELKRLGFEKKRDSGGVKWMIGKSFFGRE